MEAREESIEKFKEFASRGKTAKINDSRFKKALAPLMVEADRGFNEEEIDTLVAALTTLPLTVPKFSSLIRVIIPEVSVSKASMENMILWASFNYRNKQSCAILVLQWITVVLEHELAEKSSVDQMFELFFAMLRYEPMQRDAAKLVYMLVNPEDVTRWRVNLLLSLHRENNGKKHTNALLQRFKAYRPEIVPEAVPALGLAKAFKTTSALFADKMAAAALRGAGHHRAEGIRWDGGDGAKRRGLGWHEFIPAPLTLSLESSRRRRKAEPVAIQRFKTLESLACHQLTMALPCQAMSLLDNPAGRHLLAFGTPGLKQRFMDTLHPKLTALLRDGRVDVGHTASVLGKLASLQRMAQQGLTTVSTVLANFLHTWNGYVFREQVWELLERCSFRSELVLPQLIFPHIRRLFLQGDEREQSLIIRSMTRLIQFQFESCWRANKGLATMFEAPPPSTVDTLTLTSSFVGSLCSDGLTKGTQRHALLLDASLEFYHMVSVLEQGSEMPVWTVMPPTVFYCALFGRSMHALQAALRILIRYKTLDKQRLASLGADFTSEFETVARFAADAVNCLWDAKAFSARSTGLVFRHTTETALLSLAGERELDEAFLPQNNLAFAPFLDPTEDWKLQVNDILPELRQIVRSDSLSKSKVPAKSKMAARVK